MLTGMRAVLEFLALGALVDVAAQGLCTAWFNVLHGHEGAGGLRWPKRAR
jgi:hypothetical protein